MASVVKLRKSNHGNYVKMFLTKAEAWGLLKRNINKKNRPGFTSTAPISRALLAFFEKDGKPEADSR